MSYPNLLFSFRERNNLGDQNPLHHELTMSKKDWLRTYLFAMFVLPIRAVLLLILHIVLNMVSRIGLLGLSKEDLSNRPIVQYWRKCMKMMSRFLMRVIIRVCGLIVTTKGKMASVDEAPIIVVAPCSCFFMEYILNGFLGDMSGISAKHNLDIPFLKPFIELVQTIIVERGNTQSKANTAAEIMKRTNLHKHPNKDERWPRIVISPEENHTNGKLLMRFKDGAFNPGKPVQPLLFRYPNRLDTVTSDRNGPLQAIWVTLCQPFTRVKLEFLPVYYPSIEEQMDGELFATNVRKLMATKLSMPLCDMTFREAEEQRKQLK